jgi:hypothetical protein
LRREHERADRERDRYPRDRDRLRKGIDRLEDDLDRAKRARHRQAAPFSRGTPRRAARRPGRKPGATWPESASAGAKRAGEFGHEAVHEQSLVIGTAGAISAGTSIDCHDLGDRCFARTHCNVAVTAESAYRSSAIQRNWT